MGLMVCGDREEMAAGKGVDGEGERSGHDQGKWER